MTAFERLAGAAEQHRSGRHHFAAIRTRPAVLKRAADDDGNGHAGVLFRIRTVAGTARADNILDGPASPRCELMRVDPSGCDRNFRQETRAPAVVQLLSRKERYGRATDPAIRLLFTSGRAGPCAGDP